MKRALLVLRWMPLALSGWLPTHTAVPMFAWRRPRADQRQKAPAVGIDALLAKTADHCPKLESAILGFVCSEEISENE